MNFEELLHAADRPRELTADEARRLQDRVGIESGPWQAEQGEPVLIELSRVSSGADQRNGRNFSRWAAAAVVLVVFVVEALALGGRGSDPERVSADQPVPSAFNSLALVCAGEVSALTNALEAWRGAGNWSLTSNGDPDVAKLLADTLGAVARIDGFGVEASQVANALRQDLAGLPPAGATTFGQREIAVTRSVASLISMLRATDTPSECDLNRLESAL